MYNLIYKFIHYLFIKLMNGIFFCLALKKYQANQNEKQKVIIRVKAPYNINFQKQVSRSETILPQEVKYYMISFLIFY
jgi:hypothetical protein